ncbi:TolB family protein [Calidithermus roseus]|uniref:Uncharacterized protein n=1 Tax=Calidithermus roseus TaxID=1644118 RepID=A0A399EWU3_9DEIN|nr:hypothetical protein [Calidithermus roseus]RIH88120.1 hypothetical protein Mrose_01024 [Calidithermus roseus]
MFRRLVWGLLVLVALGSARAQLIGEVPLQQVVTPHFTVIHPPRLEGYARRVATTAEAVRGAVAGIVGNQPPHTYILVGDETDKFNGFASVFPYPIIRIYATFPQPGLIGVQWQDVLQVLLVHEYAHIAHLTTHADDPLSQFLGRYPGSNTARIPPAWFIEGYAVYLESTLTSGGRVADSTTRTLRAQIAREGEWPTLSDAGIGPLERYPGGNTRYSFGGGFVAYLVDKYGEEGLREVIRTYNDTGFDFSEAWQIALGRRLEPLWEEWKEREVVRAKAEAEALRKTGLPQAERLSAGSSPAWRSDGLLAWWQGSSVRVGWADRRQAVTPFPAFVRLPGRPDRLSWDKEGNLVYSRVVQQGGTSYGELFRLEPSGQEVRLTRGARASDAVAEGDCILYVRRGFEGSVLRRWCSGQDEEVYTPPQEWQLFHPAPGPGGSIAISVWRPGGFLDIALLREGRLEFVTSDFFQDWWPNWNPLGQLVFASDRRGSSQLYRVQDGRLYQLTAEPGGVFNVSYSSQGVVFASYGGKGLEIKRLEKLPEGLEVGALQPSSPEALALEGGQSYPVEPYSPNLLPLYWLPIGPGAYGLGATLYGSDVASIHNYRIGLGIAESGGLLAEAVYSFTPTFEGGLVLAGSYAPSAWAVGLSPLYRSSGELPGLGPAEYRLQPFGAYYSNLGWDAGASLGLGNLAFDPFGYLEQGWSLEGAVSRLFGWEGGFTLAGELLEQSLALRVSGAQYDWSAPILSEARLSAHYPTRLERRMGDGIYALERLSLVPFAAARGVGAGVEYGGGVQVLGDFVLSYFAGLGVGVEVNYYNQSGFGFALVLSDSSRLLGSSSLASPLRPGGPGSR